MAEYSCIPSAASATLLPDNIIGSLVLEKILNLSRFYDCCSV